MRGIPSLITEIRKKVFTEVARMAYSGDYTDMEDIPFKIVPGQSPLHRESVFLERAIAGERVRLAMGTQDYDLSGSNDLPADIEQLILTVKSKYSYLYQ